MKRAIKWLSLCVTVSMLLSLLLVPTSLVSAEEYADDAYIIIDDCESVTPYDGTVKRDGDNKIEGESSLSVTHNGGYGEPGFRRSGLEVPLPEGWRDWWLEMWLYVDNVANITNLSGSCIEISEIQDSIEVAWPFHNLNLQNGWNRIQVQLKAGNVDESGGPFTTLKRFRVWAITTQPVVLKIDDVVLSKTKVASNFTKLDEQIAAAQAVPQSVLNGVSQQTRLNFNNALQAAQEARNDKSQRTVDVAAANLERAILMLGFDGYTNDIEAGYAFINFADKKFSNLTAYNLNGNVVENYQGRRAAKVTGNGMYVGVSPRYMPTDQTEAKLSLTYFDANVANGKINLKYTATGGQTKTAGTITMAGSEQWKTYNVTITDAAFSKAMNGSYDVHVELSGMTEAYISQVAVSKVAQYAAPPEFAEETELNNMLGKSVTGYQMWFGQNHYHPWFSWSAGNLSMDMWPDVSDYPETSLFPSNFDRYGNGQEAKLFNSYDPAVIDLHMSWMEEYGIDGAAIQRFYAYTSTIKDQKSDYMLPVIEAAEEHGRIYYIMYDMSGATGSASATIERLQLDFVNNIEGKGFVSSPNYAHAEGKPVVCLWGLADASTNYPNAFVARELISWFKSRGYYVIVGTPDNQFATRTSDYAEAYAMADMISPWTVGRYNSVNGVRTTYANSIRNDLAYCEPKGIEYLPVMFAGFSWANMKNQFTQHNLIPRNAGRFLWEQARVVASFGLPGTYFAMFDEYDEATAIMKAASDWWDSPAASLGQWQYFLTLSTDGMWLSSDFYLRLAGDITQMLKDVASEKIAYEDVPEEVPTPHSLGPVFWRNSFEGLLVERDIVQNNQVVRKEIRTERIDPMCFARPLDYSTTSAIELAVSNDPDYPVNTAVMGERPRSGDWSFRFVGEVVDASTKVNGKFIIANAKITVQKGMQLTYFINAVNENGLYAYMDLLLRDANGNEEFISDVIKTRPVAPAQGETDEWIEVTYQIPSVLEGREIIGIAVAYDKQVEGEFDVYIDDVVLEFGDAPTDLGDINGDGQVTVTDARIALQAAVGKVTLTAEQLQQANVDGVGAVTTTDARLILQYAVGKIFAFPTK